MKNIFDIITVISAILMIVFILVQNRGSSLGEAFGGDSAVYHSRRGVEKVIFQITVVLAVVFVLSIILGSLSN